MLGSRPRPQRAHLGHCLAGTAHAGARRRITTPLVPQIGMPLVIALVFASGPVALAQTRLPPARFPAAKPILLRRDAQHAGKTSEPRSKCRAYAVEAETAGGEPE
jgi:hypothetical protein